MTRKTLPVVLVLSVCVPSSHGSPSAVLAASEEISLTVGTRIFYLSIGVENVGNETLLIGDVRSMCLSCGEILDDTIEIAPGNISYLTVRGQIRTATDSVTTNTISFRTNDPKRPNLEAEYAVRYQPMYEVAIH